MMLGIFKKIFLLIAVLLFAFACSKSNDPEPGPETGKITFRFYYYCEGSPLVFDIRKYVNAAGNEYMVNEIQYFISDVKLHTDDTVIMIDEWKDIHYVDSDISSTQEWNVYDAIPAGEYDRISFTFGINEEKNQSLMFTDPPESLMFWPEYLGGGYHYMKLNGKWLDTTGLERPYNFHLGIGQVYDPDTVEITGFIQNYFEVNVINSSFTVEKGNTTVLDLVMQVDRWFCDPHTYNHNEWGGDIMQKQQAMKLGCENGWDVFKMMNF